MFEFKQFDIVLINLSIASHYFRDGDVLVVVVGKIGLELSFELIDLYPKGIKLLLDLDGLISNDIDDILFDLIDFLLSLVESAF